MWNAKNKRAWMAWTIAGVLALGAAAALSASAVVGSDWARQYLIRKFETASGSQLHAETLTLRLTPALRIDAAGLGISNPAWAGSDSEPDFLRARSASLKIALLPLLIGRIHLENAQMDGIKLILGRGDKIRRWEIPSLTLDAGAREARTDMQISAGERTVHLNMQAGDLPALQNGGSTTIALHADVPAQAAAGNIDIKGSLGLRKDLNGTDLRVHVDAPANSPWQFLAGLAGRELAAIKLDTALRGQDGNLEIAQLAFALGDLRVDGQGVLHTAQKPWRLEGQLRTDALDWAQMTRDAGLPQPPPKPPGALFRDVPLAWPLLQDIDGYTADLDLRMRLLKLRAGLPLQNVAIKMQLQNDQMRIPAFSANFAGGTATADALFTGHDRRVKLNLKASGVSIEQWRGFLNKSKFLSGAPLAVNASVEAGGASMNQLAATMTGPVSLRMGRTVVHSSRGSDAESLLTGLIPALAGKRADHMDVVCLVASLPFKDGRASGTSIAGARTESSQLLTDGVIDLRDQTLDLHGRVTGIDGARLGLSMFAGDVNISGKLVKPQFRLDARGLLGTAARVGAAVLSFGLTAVGQTLWDANADDACKLAAQRPETKRPVAGERAVPRE